MVGKRRLGRHGLDVSKVAIGTWAMGGGVYGEVDDEESLQTLGRAHELGVNMVDTAPIYGMGAGVDGHAERLVGRAIRSARESWIVCTKWGRNLDAARHGADDPRKMVQDFSYDRALRSVEESLERLGADHVDLYFVHSPTPNTLFDPRSLRAMDELQEAGVIRLRGFSLGSTEDLELIEPFVRDGRLDCVQVAFSLLDQSPRHRLLDLCAEFGVGVVAREVLARGFLSGRFTADERFPPTDFRSFLPGAEIERRLALAERYRFLTEDGRSLPQAAVSWVLSHGHVASVVAGPKTVAELEETVAAACSPRFDDATLERVATVSA